MHYTTIYLLEVLGHELFPKWNADLILNITPISPVSQTSPFNLSFYISRHCIPIISVNFHYFVASSSCPTC